MKTNIIITQNNKIVLTLDKELLTLLSVSLETYLKSEGFHFENMDVGISRIENDVMIVPIEII